MANGSACSSSPERISARERQAQALDLRRAGWTFDKIAHEVGYNSRQACQQAITAAMARITDETAKEARTIDLSRIDRMLEALWNRVEQGDTSVIDCALRCLSRRAKLLGLDAAVKIAGHDGGPLQIDVNDARQKLADRITHLAAQRATAPGAAMPN